VSRVLARDIRFAHIFYSGSYSYRLYYSSAARDAPSCTDMVDCHIRPLVLFSLRTDLIDFGIPIHLCNRTLCKSILQLQKLG
jgi:hypothetical protein